MRAMDAKFYLERLEAAVEARDPDAFREATLQYCDAAKIPATRTQEIWAQCTAELASALIDNLWIQLAGVAELVRFVHELLYLQELLDELQRGVIQPQAGVSTAEAIDQITHRLSLGIDVLIKLQETALVS